MTVDQALDAVRPEFVRKLIETALDISDKKEPIGDYFETDEGFIDVTVRVSIGNEEQVVEKYGQEVYDLLMSDW